MLKKYVNIFRRFPSAEGGNVVVFFALIVPIVLGGVAFAIDGAQVQLQRTSLQDAADAAALGAARELYITSGRSTAVQAIAESYAKANLGKRAETVRVKADVGDQGSLVEVKLTDRTAMYFAALFGAEDTDITATASARIAGGGRVCIIGLDGKGKDTIHLKDHAYITAPTCGIYSNSTHSAGLVAQVATHIEGELICSAGGVSGGSKSFSPAAQTDCPAAEDPLAKRATPPVGACDHNELEIKDQTVKLKPGTYCGGLRISGCSTVTLDPGVYVIKDGPLDVDGTSSFKGEYVGFYFTGTNASFRFASGTSIDLGAPKEGPMAGLLVYEDPKTSEQRTYEVLSNDARNLLGTIYLPKGLLKVEGVNKVADQSAYTAIVARQMEMRSGPNLYLNTNYSATDVPVPDGIAPIGRNIWLEN